MNNVALALLMSLVAGLSTGIGGLIAVLVGTTNRKFLAISLGFSAGVMIYISFVEILHEAEELLVADLGGTTGLAVAVVAFFAGMAIAGVIDKVIPEEIGLRLSHQSDDQNENADNESLMRTGLVTAAAVTAHNFPEGVVTFIAALHDPVLAVPIVFAIALHNIPEGMSVSAPIYFATGSRAKALLYSFASGLAEPLGALAAYFVLMPFLNDVLFGIVFAMTAGIMVFIAFDELLPSARKYGDHHLSLYGLIAGMAVMAVSLIFLG